MIITRMIIWAIPTSETPSCSGFQMRLNANLSCNNDFYLRENLIKNFAHPTLLRTSPESVSRKWPMNLATREH